MDKLSVMTQIEENVKICKKCRLFQTANHPVPGEGNINSELIFIGEAPGATEDLTGRPFVGRAGKLLASRVGSLQIRISLHDNVGQLI